MSWNTESGVKIFSLLLPRDSNEAVGVSNYILQNLNAVISLLSVVNTKWYLPDDAGIAIGSKFPLSTTMYFYMSDDLGLQDKADIDRAYSASGYTVRFFGFAYYRSKLKDENFLKSLKNTTQETVTMPRAALIPAEPSKSVP